MGVSSYPKIWNLGNDAIEYLFEGPVEITEKVDGSLFAFGVDKNGSVVMRSKGKEMFTACHDGMFADAVAQVEKREEQLLAIAEELKSGFFVYGEYLNKPKHNTLAYGRMPKNNIIVFSVKIGQNFLRDYDEIKKFADRLDFETVPVLFRGEVETDPEKRLSTIKNLVDNTPSILGENTVEGVVIKNYTQLTTIGHPTVCFGKHVKDEFKERNMREWKASSEKSKEQALIESYRTEAFWLKVIQHARDDGELENSPRDIGKLIGRAKKEWNEEHWDANVNKDSFTYKIAKLFHPKVERKVVAGLPEFYKEQLLKKQCET